MGIQTRSLRRGVVFSEALSGNMKAARLFMEISGGLVKTQTTTQNFIQINGLVLNENSIKQLPEARILELENLVRQAMSELIRVPIENP